VLNPSGSMPGKNAHAPQDLRLKTSGSPTAAMVQ
jgi:hypothetical protein